MKTQAKNKSSSQAAKDKSTYRPGGELHQNAGPGGPVMTTDHGTPVSDAQNSLKIGPRGPVALEDFILLEKINRFDHERIPERVVHARGSAAHGYFVLTSSLSKFSRASILTKVGHRTPVFTRFSTVAGSKGSGDVARDVRGFAVKFYTDEGNWDLVGNNIPVFFIQDAIKFPDLIHAAKPDPDREFPQAQTAHDTFWDFVSLTPESTHMLMWVMSDRAIPRSLRMMEGFGVHTFRLVNESGKSTFVKFHWRPRLQSQSVIWDEALKLNGADPDYHRRDLWNAINEGSFPEWDLAVQIFDETFAEKFDFDVLDATKLIPEELVPLKVIGKMVLDRNPDNFFAETEQVAFCTSHVVPGIDFSNDPLLQGRNFSYQDTQITRLGGPNFAQIPVNRPRCPMHNFQRDGHMQMDVPKGQVNYEPNSLSATALPRESAERGFRSASVQESGEKVRVRSETFADHTSQALQFFVSQTPEEQNHIIAAFIFELSKVQTTAVRDRMLGRLAAVDPAIAKRVAAGLGHKKPITPAQLTVPTRNNLKPSPSLSLHKKFKPTIEGRLIGCLVADGFDGALVKKIRLAVEKEGAQLKIVAPTVTVMSASGQEMSADFQLAGGPSVLFDGLVVCLSEEGMKAVAKDSGAKNFVADGFAHLKVIGFTKDAQKLLEAAGAEPDEGVIELTASRLGDFVNLLKRPRIWAREPKVRAVY